MHFDLPQPQRASPAPPVGLHSHSSPSRSWQVQPPHTSPHRRGVLHNLAGPPVTPPAEAPAHAMPAPALSFHRYRSDIALQTLESSSLHYLIPPSHSPRRTTPSPPSSSPRPPSPPSPPLR